MIHFDPMMDAGERKVVLNAEVSNYQTSAGVASLKARHSVTGSDVLKGGL